MRTRQTLMTLGLIMISGLLSEAGWGQSQIIYSEIPTGWNSQFVDPAFERPFETIHETVLPTTYVEPARGYFPQTIQPFASTPAPITTTNIHSGATPGLAQSKANQAAQMGLRGHVGSGLGGAKYEGVGWSSTSAHDAVRNCCYWGQRQPCQIGVSQGADGVWYACVLYQ